MTGTDKITVKAGFSPKNLTKLLSPVEINPDISDLTETEQIVVQKLIVVSKIFNEIFFEQKMVGNLEIYKKVKELGDEDLSLFYKVMQGPFDVLNDNKPFIEGVKKSEMASFFPEDLTDNEWEAQISMLKKNNPEQLEQFLSPYTIIVRNESGQLEAVPYTEVYKQKLTEASDILYEISKICENITEREYYRALSNSCLTNDFNDANIRWLQLENNNIESVLGPQELYEDKFLGLKASFTSFISVKNKHEFKKLDMILQLLDVLQSNLPMLDCYKKKKPTMSSQILVVNLLYNAGDARGPVQTAAFNLPNSHKVKSEFGSKKVLLYNIMEAKFNEIMLPISQMIMDDKNLDKISYPAYFNFILMHEIGHELGVSFIRDKDGNLCEVSHYLKDLYSVIEEAKADLIGMFSLNYLIKNGFINDCTRIEACNTYLAGLFRSMRFGSENAHCVANIIQFNYLLEQRAIIKLEERDEKFTYSIDLLKFDKSIEQLLTIILTLQAAGDYDKANDFIEQYSVINDDLKQTISLFTDIPIDILPKFMITDED